MFRSFGLVLIALTMLANGEPVSLDGSLEEEIVQQAVIEEVAHFAVANHPGSSLEDGFFDALEKVVSAREQFVAGKLYTLKLLVGSSGCPLKGHFDHQLCKVKASSTSRLCTAEVHVQVWMKPQSAVTSWKCD